MKLWIIHSLVFTLFFSVCGLVINAMSGDWIISHEPAGYFLFGFMAIGVFISVVHLNYSTDQTVVRRTAV